MAGNAAMPPNLTRLTRHKSGAAWLQGLPRLIDELADRWGLALGPPYAGSNISYVAPARSDGQPVVLKIQWPHAECAHEGKALHVWNGNGAIRLLDQDASRHALLLEHCSPGVHLSVCKDVAPLDVLIDLLPRLWVKTGSPFKTLREEAVGWEASLHEDWENSGRRYEKRLIDAAIAFVADLSESQPEQVLIHQDLHGDNVLSAERKPWLVIDPKPLVGERAFALAPIIRSFEFGHSRKAVTERLDRLSAELDIDRERARGWTIAQTMAWSFESDHADRHHETAQWLLDA